ncbi:MAG: hypothetical protein NUV52_03325 [Candidatus Roizmanbacteria bacterium]|nr:hypothetical protein [Candidatus Roizmanbacteria bacterium]
MSKDRENCEESCIFFKALREEDQPFNRFARQETMRGRDVPGSLACMCGACIHLMRNYDALDALIELSSQRAKSHTIAP